VHGADDRNLVERGPQSIGGPDAVFDKGMRLAALGGPRNFDGSPSSSEGWRGGSWWTGYRDPQPAARMAIMRSANDGKRLATSGGEAPVVPPVPTSPRWAAAAWLLARPGGTIDPGRPIARYGASQVGALVEYRFGAATAPHAYLRATRALGDAGEAEVAAGLRLAIADLPLAAHIERRFSASGTDRNAMALFVSGGFSAGDPRRLATEAYGQAGIVGFRRKTRFVDAAIVARRHIATHGPLTLAVGAGGWIGAQPGASRVDVGPRIEAQYDDGLHARLSLDWRERVGGSAKPGSGPALTLALTF
jgi:hypothetical protein